MGFSDQLTRFFQFKGGGQKAFGIKDPYELWLEDDTTYIVDPVDTTKRVRLDAGNVSTGTTRVFNFANADVTQGKTTQLSATGGLTLTTAQTGSTVLFDAAGATAVALPAIAAGDVGVKFTFLWTATATGAHSITAQTGDLLLGVALMGVTGAGDVDAYFPNGSSNLVLAVNGSTTGGLKGSMAVFEATSATSWNVYSIQQCTGTQTTPFA